MFKSRAASSAVNSGDRSAEYPSVLGMTCIDFSISPPSRCFVEKRKVNFAYDAWAHWDWVLDVAGSRIRELQERGRKPRRNGLPWILADATTPREQIGSYDRYVEWQRSINALARVLPSALRPALAQVIKLGVEVNVPSSRAITDPERVRRLQADCLRRIKQTELDQRERDAERKRITVALEIINPSHPALIPVPHREHAAPVITGQLVTVGATPAFLAGYVSSVPSQPGYPIIGISANQIPGGCVVVPEARPKLDDTWHQSSPRLLCGLPDPDADRDGDSDQG